MSGEPAPRFIIASKTRLKSSGKVSKRVSVEYIVTIPTASKCNGQGALEDPSEVD